MRERVRGEDIALVKAFVEAVIAYDSVDEEWCYPADKRVHDAWDQLRLRTEQLFWKLCDVQLTEREMNAVFGWETTD